MFGCASLQAIASRNQLRSVTKQREALQQQLHALIREKKMQLERSVFVSYETCTKWLIFWTTSRQLIYTVNHKKRDILFLSITLANLNILYHFNHEKFPHATVVKFTASPYLRAHLTS